MSERYCFDNVRHYVFISPEMESGGGMYEPPEYLRDVAVVEATTTREARWLALRSDHFKEWSNYARGEGRFPIAGIKVQLSRCDHGVCWDCSSCLPCRRESLVFGRLD